MSSPFLTCQSTVELRGHLLDSLTLAKVLDKIQAMKAGYQLNNFQVGSRKDHVSSASLTIQAESSNHLTQVLEALLPYGALPNSLVASRPIVAQSAARVRLTGHLLDTLLLAKAIDRIQAHQAEFHLDQVRVGESKQDSSQVDLSIYSPTTAVLDQILGELVAMGGTVLFQPQTIHRTDASDRPKVLMCEPTYFEVAYAINPWMTHGQGCDEAMAKQQWRQLHDAISKVADVLLLDAKPGMPDLVFTANAAFIYGKKALVANYKHPERKVEEPVVTDWFQQQGYDTITLPVVFEGAGDALIWQDRVFAGYRTRTDIAAHSLITAETGLPVLSLELIDDRFYHIDVCLCPLPDGSLIYAPDAFDNYGRTVIEANVPAAQRIPVYLEEAQNFACNAVGIGSSVFLNEGSPQLVATLKERGFTVVELPMGEFIKSGGSAKCCTLRLS